MKLLATLWLPILIMGAVIVSSNVLMSYPINEMLVWGALTFPLAFLVTDLTNRFYGASNARLVVYCGFMVGIPASLYFADVRIALASGTAFLLAQLLDITVFNRLRQMVWWIAPLVSSGLSTIIDTGLFYGLAFGGTDDPWQSWAIGDLGVKWAVTLLALIPYGLLIYGKPRTPARSPD